MKSPKRRKLVPYSIPPGDLMSYGSLVKPIYVLVRSTLHSLPWLYAHPEIFKIYSIKVIYSRYLILAAALSGTQRLQTLSQKRAVRKLRYDRISADHTILHFCIYEKCSITAVVTASCILSTNVEHSNMMFHVQTLVLCSRSQAMIEILYQTIIISLEISDCHIKTIRHICPRSRSQATFQLKIHIHG